MGGGQISGPTLQPTCTVPECPIAGQNRESEAWRRLPGTREGQRTLGLQGNRLQGNRLKDDKQYCISGKALANSRTAQPRAISGVSCAELAESSSSSKGRFGLTSVGSVFLGCCSARL
jgi:hypothetical protein